MIRNYFFKVSNKYASKWVVLFVDIILVCISFTFTFFFRFTSRFDQHLSELLNQLPLIILISFTSFIIVGSYKSIIRHTGTKDAFNVFYAATLIAFITTFLVILNQFFSISSVFVIPRSILLIHYLLSVFILIISRYVFKSFYDVISTELKSITNVLIYGAGNSGIITYAAINREKKNNYKIVGFVDDEPRKINKKIDRIKIYDSKLINADFIDKNSISEIIISIQNIEPDRLLEIADKFLKFDVKIKIIPTFSKWIEGDLQVNQIKQIDIDDLLNRKQIFIDNPIVEREVNNKVVFVTGAAGSIGSEISRQLASHNLKMLVLIDQAESTLYDLQQELMQKGIENFIAIVADVRDRKRMFEIFEEYQPQRVFHAAAYKHVPLMEQNPYEAVKINIYGTKNIADLSLEFKVDRFVLVSTDKAVNPTNVMGATKRVAELYVSALSKEKNGTKFTITRFGNVLGSNGSVIPLFKRQIENGGPLTLTHKDITRYFMTIPEACRLVLEAGTMGEGGEIYIFDMGPSVKIFDLAKRMITLSGLKYPKDIDIKITGLRPGEKLYEELLSSEENTTITYHEKIMIAKSLENNLASVREDINKLCKDNLVISGSQIVQNIKKIVPEYISKNSVFEKLDIK
jgi:FlaA1/EpsC-like NDP-sugar epimerase